MEFFRELSRIGAGFKKITITIMEKDGKQTVAFLPESTNDSVNRKLIPVSLNGTPMEVDEGFFPNIIQAVEKVNGLTTNLEAVTQKLEEKTEEDAPEAKPKEKSKEKPKKKVAAKKKAAAPTSGPNAESDKHHQADLEETKIEEEQEEPETTDAQGEIEF